MGASWYLTAVNWQTYQHYRDRDPPWIKLHAKIRESYDFRRLPDASKAHVLMCLILASRSDNHVPADAQYIGELIGARSGVVIDDLIASGMFAKCLCDKCLESCSQDASAPIAGCEQDASGALAPRARSREAEAEAEAERETEGAATPRRARSRAPVREELLIPDSLRRALPDIEALWRERMSTPRQKPTISAQNKQLAALAGWLDDFGADGVRESIAKATRGGHQGVFPPDGRFRRDGAPAPDAYLDRTTTTPATIREGYRQELFIQAAKHGVSSTARDRLVEQLDSTDLGDMAGVRRCYEQAMAEITSTDGRLF